MFRKSVAIIVAMLAFCLLLTSCKKEGGSSLFSREPVSVEEYITTLPDRKLKNIRRATDLLRHPLKDAIERFGDDYEITWEGVYAELHFHDIGCAFEVYVGEEFARTDPYTKPLTFEDCNVIEYLSFAMIERVIFESEKATLTDKITVGMTADEICKKLRAESIQYSESSVFITEEYDENNKKVDVYSITGYVGDNTYIVVFKGDVLSSVELVLNSSYIAPEGKLAKNGSEQLREAFAYIDEHDEADFDIKELTYKGEVYSSYYDSWFYGWEFNEGSLYEEFVLRVEKDAPHRIYIERLLSDQAILFWADGKYVSPMLSNLGKWREHDSNEYIDIKSISKEGIVIFDMYIEVDKETGEMLLIENLNTAIEEIPKTLRDFIAAEYNDEALGGEIQLFDGNVQSGYFTYAGDKSYLCDSLFMDFNGSVQYLPRGFGGRVGAGPLTFHIPSGSVSYEQSTSHGYMENFGRDDPNKDNRQNNKNKTGASVIDSYLNQVYETSGLKYSELEYKYLYDYVFPVSNITYGVWESLRDATPHYIYVDAKNKMIIKEVDLGIYRRHSKLLIYKGNSTVSGKSYANQKFVSTDGKITVDLINRVITKPDAFVSSIEIPELYLDSVDNNERFMFFSNIGNRFMLNGYVLFDHTTWGATLHITDSNIPDFGIGVYYLDSESFFLDPSIGVVSIPETTEKDKYLDEKIEDTGKETKHVIRNFNGQIIGYIHVNEQGKKTVKDYYGRILGYYKPDSDVTTDYYGKIVARGDAASALLFGSIG